MINNNGPEVEGKFGDYEFWGYHLSRWQRNHTGNDYRVYIKHVPKNRTWAGIEFINFKYKNSDHKDVPMKVVRYVERYLRAHALR